MRLTLLTATPVVLALGLAGCASGPHDSTSRFTPSQSNPPYTADHEYRQRMEGTESRSTRVAPPADNRSQFTPEQSQRPYTAAPGYRERVDGSASPSRAY